MNLQALIRMIKDLIDDPLAQVFICTIKSGEYEIRYNGGYVQMRKGDANFTLGVPAEEWLAEYGYVSP